MATLTVNATLGNDSVSNAQLENMAQGTIKGRTAGAGTGDPTDLTPDQASTILDAATDPFVRTSNLPSGGGDVVGPASSTDNNVPQWDGTTGKLLKNGLGVSQGGNGASDANKLVQFKSDGGVEAATGLLAGPALYGETNALNQPAVQGYSTNGGEGGRFQSVGGDGVSGSSDDGAGLRGTNSGTTNPPLHVNNTDATNSAPLAWIHNVDDEGLEVDNDGGLSWTTATGAQTSRNNVLPSKSGNALKVLRVNGAESDYELVDGVVDGSTLSIGLTFPNAGLKIADQNADHTLVLVPDENLTADRQLSILVNDDNRIIDLSGDLKVSANATVSGTNTGDVSLAGTPNYITISGQTITRALIDLASHVTGVLPLANGGGQKQVASLSSDFTTSSASYVDVTGLSVTLDANSRYQVNITGTYQSTNAGTGAMVSLTRTGSPTVCNFERVLFTAAATPSELGSIGNVDDLGTAGSSVDSANTDRHWHMNGVVVTGASPCTIQVRAVRGGAANNINIRQGSCIVATKLN